MNHLRGIEARDEDSWRRLAELCAPEVLRWALDAGLDGDEAQDLRQEVFTSLARHFPDFHGPGRAMRFWHYLHLLTQHKAAEFVRRIAELAQPLDPACLVELPAPAQASEAPATAGPRLARLRRALKDLEKDFDSQTMTAFCEVTLHGRAQAEVAAELGMTVPAVRQACHRVFARLRERLSPKSEAD